MQTNINIIDSIVICKGESAHYAYLRFRDKYYDRDMAHESLETLHGMIGSYLFKRLHISSR